MTIGELMEDSREEGRTEGLKRMLTLTSAMTKNGDGHLIPSLEKDRDLLERMYEKYHI